MKKTQAIGFAMLTFTALIWGSTFVVQSKAAELIPPMWFICLRNALGALVLLPVIAVLNRSHRNEAQAARPSKRRFILASVICALSLCAGAYLQQLAITMGALPGKAAFITAMYIVLTPIGSLFFGKKIRLIVLLSVPLSVIGLYLLSMNGGFRFAATDLILIGAAICFTIQILAVEKFSPDFDPVKLSAAQFAFCSLFSFIYAIIFEQLTLSCIKAGWFYIIFSGIFASGAGYTLQIVGQKKLANPTVASMLMSMESVFGALSAAVFLHQMLSMRETIGCAVMFAAIIISQLPERKNKTEAKHAGA